MSSRHDPLDLAYMAGLYDGEGSFSIQVALRGKRRKSVYFNPRMTVNMKESRIVLEALRAAFGGGIHPNPAKGTDMWVLGRRAKIQEATEALLPFLRLKKPIAERFLHALSLFPAKRADHLAGERTWTVGAVLEVAEIALTLNPSTARRAKKSHDVRAYLDELRAVYGEGKLDMPLQVRTRRIQRIKGGPPPGWRRIKDPATGKWGWFPPDHPLSIANPKVQKERDPNRQARLGLFREARQEADLTIEEARAMAEGVRGVSVSVTGNKRYFIAHAKAARPFPPNQREAAQREQNRLTTVMRRYKTLRKAPELEVREDGWLVAHGLARIAFPLTRAGFARAKQTAKELRAHLIGEREFQVKVSPYADDLPALGL